MDSEYEMSDDKTNNNERWIPECQKCGSTGEDVGHHLYRLPDFPILINERLCGSCLEKVRIASRGNDI